MQLLEVKNDIAKIIYNPAENHLLPSDFLLIEDINQKLIAQILNISTTESSNNIADVRLALSIDKEDNLSYYNGYIPSKTSSVVYISPDEIIELIKGTDESIFFGNLSNHQDCFVKPSISFLDDKLYIQSDREDKTTVVVKNIVSELKSKQKKIILIDFDGRYNSLGNVPRIKISEGFKLPLNIDAFNTILEYDTTDCPLEDKAVIQSIVLELREYLRTLDNAFLPFTLFKNVIDNEFMANPISGLMLLRNKLWLYAQDGIFAESKSQFDIINSIMDNQDVLVIDATELEEKWYKFAIQTVVSLVNKNCYLAISLNDVPLDKKSVVALFNKHNIIPIVSTTYDSKYRQVLKSVCKNHVLFKPSSLLDDDELYSVLLNKINTDEFIVYGEATLYLPLIIELQLFNSATSEHVVENEIKKDVDKFLSSPQTVIPSDTNVSDVIPRPMSMMDEDIIVEEIIEDDFDDADLDFIDEQNQEQITIEDIRSKKQVKVDTQNEYGVFVPMSVQEANQQEISTIEDIDEILSDDKNEDIDSILSDAETQEKNDEIASIDDVIDDITSNVQEENAHEKDLVVEFEEDEVSSSEEKPLPPPVNNNVKPKESPELPVYETEIQTNSSLSDLPFKIGDRVYHPKHGNGVIEGFANYSNKILFCHIEFDDVGRRILDPRIAGLEKIS